MTKTRTGDILDFLNFLIISAGFVAAFIALSAIVVAVTFIVWAL